MASLKKRGKTYYAQYYVAGQQQRRNLETTSLQVAKERLRQLESAMVRQDDLPFPTKTPLPGLLAEYVQYIRVTKVRNTVKIDLHYLRELFGFITPELEAPRSRAGVSQNHLALNCLEDLTTADVARLISTQVQDRGLAPKTANRYREVIHTFVNWAIEERGVKMHGGVNPVTRVKRYREKAPDIRFLTMTQIDEQLAALESYSLLQAMVALYIYAGLRREEALWLTREDIDLKSGPYGTIRVRAKTIGGESWQPKTRVNRAVPISSDLRRWLDRYQARIVPGHWFFPSPEGKRWDQDNFSRTLRQANKKAHLPWGCLDYRHTFGSQLAMKGESLYKIATLMGNSPQICQRHYAAITPESLSTSVEFARMVTFVP